MGKTTLVKKILENHKDKRTRYFNCDLISVQQGLGVQEAEILRYYLGDNDLVVLDERAGARDVMARGRWLVRGGRPTAVGLVEGRPAAAMAVAR